MTASTHHSTVTKCLNLGHQGQVLFRNNLDSFKKADVILQLFKSIECHFCSRHVGFARREDTGVFLCSSPCLAMAALELPYSLHNGYIVENKHHPDDVLKMAKSFLPSSAVDASKSEPPITVESASKALLMDELTNVNSEKSSTESSSNYTPKKSSTESSFTSTLKPDSGVDEWGDDLPNAYSSKKSEVSVASEPPSVDEDNERISTLSEKSSSVGTNEDPMLEKWRQEERAAMLAKARMEASSPLSKSVPKLVAIRRKFTKGIAAKHLSRVDKTADMKEHVDHSGSELSKVERKKWTTNSLKISPCFVNGEKCFVTHIWSLNRFALTAVADFGKVDELKDLLNRHASKVSPMVRLPSKGEVIFARHQKEVCRAEAVSSDSCGNFVEVHFIDFGDSHKVQLKDCWEADDNIMMKHPFYYSINFTCDVRVKCPSNTEIPDDVKNKTTSFVYIKSLPEGIAPPADKEWTGTLFLNEVKTKSLNTFIEKLLLKNESSKTSSDDTNDDQIDSIKSNNTVLAASANPGPSKIELNPSLEERPLTTIIKRSNPFISHAKDKPFKRSFFDAKLSPHLRSSAQVQVVHQWHPQQFQLVAKEDIPNLEILAEVVAKHVAKAPAMARKPDIYELVLAPFNHEQHYFRAVVTSITPSQLEVQYVDYGGSGKFKLSQLKELSPEIDEHPLYGIIFQMKDVPEDLPYDLKVDDERVLDNGGQIELLHEEDHGVWSGYLWLAADRNWNQMVLEALLKYQR